MTNYIGGYWVDGQGAEMVSHDPATSEHIWNGRAATPAGVTRAFEAAREAFEGWARTPLERRLRLVRRFRDAAKRSQSDIARLIARETGKVLWDAGGEAGALAAKVDISVKAYRARTGKAYKDAAFGGAQLRHHPHGVMAVLGPYNFPAHLPNGQIIPSLIAGNTVVFKPSELTPAVGEALIRLYMDAGFPPGVVNMVQGGGDVGASMLDNPELNGVLFTGSARTGAAIHAQFGGRPEIILALEMGGNNPLIIWDAGDVRAAASIAVQSAFITSGQRCTCARRLIVPGGETGDMLINAVITETEKLTLGSWKDGDAASIGPVINEKVAGQIVEAGKGLIEAGAKPLRPARISPIGYGRHVEPGIYDVTGCDVPDAEIFGPVLQIIRAKDWQSAIDTANATRFGLAAGLVSDRTDLWEDFRAQIRAGIVNFNRPSTGAASFMPFGGPGASGNNRPGAFYAADFCAWPMASQIAQTPEFLPLKGRRS